MRQASITDAMAAYFSLGKGLYPPTGPRRVTRDPERESKAEAKRLRKQAKRLDVALRKM